MRTGLASEQKRASRSSGKPFAPRCVRTRRRRREARDELSQLASSDHTTTGDAFIVFQYVADRDRFITMFHPAPVALEDGGLSDICEQIVLLDHPQLLLQLPQGLR